MGPTPGSSSSSTTVVGQDGSNSSSTSTTRSKSMSMSMGMGTVNGFSLGVAGPAVGSGPAASPSSSGSSSSNSNSNGKSSKPFAHFDDINNVPLEVDADTPVDSLLAHTEASLKQAQFAKSIGHLDVALQNYIKASVILLEVLPRNAALRSVMSARKGAWMQYISLCAQISAESAAYDSIKVLIKADNARSGVTPKTVQEATATATTSQHVRAKSTANNSTGSHWPDVSANHPASKTKPTVQPKPQSLHGNSIRPGGNNANGNSSSSKSTQDLAERFAKLRAAKEPAAAAVQPSEPKQDPRIRTQPINHTSFQLQPQAQQAQQQQQQHSTLGMQFKAFRFDPQQTPASGSPRPQYPALIAPLPDLPKVPDAIYSPARGSVSSQAAQPPSSTPKGMFSRTNSTTSFTGMTKTPAPPSSSEDYFSLRLSSDRAPPRPYQDPAPPRRPRISIPDGDTITVQDLFRFIKAGSKEIRLLLIDIRSREDFDEGHIMSQATICVDVDTLQRENIAADAIADSLVLAPTTEKRLFDSRHDFDLVVYYDQDARAIRLTGDGLTAAEKAVVALYNALAYYDFAHADGEQNKKPKLLKGGLDEWTEMMGSASLQTSSTMAGVTQRSRRNVLTRPHSKYMAKPIQDAAEAKRWEESLNNMEKLAIRRTTEDFLRRFPSVSAIQESMTSEERTERVERAERAEKAVKVEKEKAEKAVTSSPRSSSRSLPTAPDIYSTLPTLSTLPTPPARPAPTVPRQSHSELAEADDEDHYMRTKLAKAGASGGGRLRRQKVGLFNPGNWCYGNSSFQSLFASGGFSEELTMGEWASRWKVPMKSDEKISHPQLLAKILANSFHWMQYGKFEAMKAKTLMDYCYHIHSHDFDGSTKTDRSTIFGGPYQQDAQEFISFLLTNLHDETNRLRDRTGEVQQPTLDARSTALSNGMRYWNEYRRYNDSLVDKYWRGVEVTDRRCRSCGHPSLTYEPFDALHLPIPPTSSGTSVTTMADLLAQYCSADVLAEYKCDACRRTDTTDKRVRLVRLPDLLCVSFRRFQGNEHAGFRKNNTAVVFPIDGLDMAPYTVQGQLAPQDIAADLRGVNGGRPTEPQFCGPFLYDCYAVIVHSGTLRSGHYRAFVRDEGGSAAAIPAINGSGSPSNSVGAAGSSNNNSSSNSSSSSSADSHQWHHFDDARVEAVTIGSGDGRDMARRLYRDNDAASAYVVFYKRRK